MERMDKFQIMAILLVALVLAGCVFPNGGKQNTTTVQNASQSNNSNQTVQTQCEQDCDDNNSCTRDTCGKATDFECQYEKLTGKYSSCKTTEKCKEAICAEGDCITRDVFPCCGNSICETNENYYTCKEDCNPVCPKTCEDGLPCTFDYCNETSNYSCAHTPLDGLLAGCNETILGCYGRKCVSGSCKAVEYDNCCGNNLCEKNEDCNSCSSDCPLCFADLTLILLTDSKANTYNCKPIKSKIQVNNPSSNYTISITSPDAVSVNDLTESAPCTIMPDNFAQCVVVVPASFGKIGKNTEKVTVTMEGKKPNIIGNETVTIYRNSFSLDIENEIDYYTESCEQNWCKPNQTWTWPAKKGFNYTIVGMVNYRERRMCHAYIETADNKYYGYFTYQNDYTCIRRVSKKTFGDESEECSFV